ncbi:MAG: hypothetical protein JWM84_1886, partial [Nocardioides sp.]|nr:hypothetical protein [Nocardioides sp.]
MLVSGADDEANAAMPCGAGQPCCGSAVGAALRAASS